MTPKTYLVASNVFNTATVIDNPELINILDCYRNDEHDLLIVDITNMSESVQDGMIKYFEQDKNFMEIESAEDFYTFFGLYGLAF